MHAGVEGSEGGELYAGGVHAGVRGGEIYAGGGVHAGVEVDHEYQRPF